jgi:hypothetical protein
MKTDTDHCTDVCNRLLRGEQSAVATYSKAIAAMEKENAAPAELREIIEDHRGAVMILIDNVRSMGGEPSKDSGAWGVFANSVQGTADLMGDKSALISLKTGETSGKNSYKAALDDENVMPECKDLIRTDLLPATERHIRTLDLLGA